jgi:glutamate synthase domain-containing protein 2
MVSSSHVRYVPWLITAPAALLALPVSPVASAVLVLLFALGCQDYLQTKQAVRRNYPLTGRLRYALEYIRPEIRQYFLEDDEQKLPFSRSERAMVYARSKEQNDKRGFGSIKDLYTPGTEWITHSMQPEHIDPASLRVTVGGPQCRQPYAMSLLNISGMSFGALSPNAIKALNKGAAHDTGEGSISVHHREHGGDLIWQIASGYFGCRTPEGRFDPERFAAQAQSPQVKMIELKLSQGAKPGHGGVLPKAKVSAEIAEARGVPMGQDCVFCRSAAPAVRGQTGGHQAVRGSPGRVVGHRQGHAADRSDPRLCGGRRGRGRHRGCTHRICRPCGHAAARRPAAGAQQPGGRGPA